MRGGKALLALGVLVLGVMLAGCISDSYDADDKLTPDASCFDVTYDDPNYTGTEKTVTVTLKSGITGMGTFSWKYVGERVNVSATPFKVYVDVISEGDNYTTESDILVGEFTISPIIPTSADFVYTKPANLTYTGTDKVATVEAKSTIVGMGDITVGYDGDRRNVGNCRVVIDVTSGTNYLSVNDLYVGDFDIVQAVPTENEFDIDMGPKEYDGTVKEPAIALKTGVSGMGPYNIIYGSTDHINAGSYSVMIRVGDGSNYSSADIDLGMFEITKAEPTAALFDYEGPDDLEYDGTAKTATVTLKSGIKGFGGFTVEYSDSNVNAGSCYVTVDVEEGVNYEAALDLEVGYFEITRAVPTADHFDFIEPANLTYDGTAKTATVKLKQGYSGVGDIVIHYSGTSVTSGKCINAGKYDVSITLTPGTNFQASGSIAIGNFTIAKADPEITAPQIVQNLVYSGQALNLIKSGTTSGGTMKYVLSPGTSYSTTIPSATEPGSYTVYYKVDGNQNYNNVSAVALPEVKIDKKVQTATMADVNFTYSTSSKVFVQVSGLNEHPEMTYSVISGIGASVNSTSGLLTWNSESDGTTVKAAFGETAHYKSGFVTCSVKTIKADSGVSKPTVKTGLKYNGDPQELVTEGTIPSGSYFTYSVSGGDFTQGVPTATNAGDYSVQCYFNGGKYYKDVSWGGSMSVSISKATMADVPQMSFVYNGESTYTEYEFSTGVKGETVTLSYQMTSKNADTYVKDSSPKGFTISYSGTQNYLFGKVGNMVIEKAELPDIGEKKETYNGSLTFTTTNFATGVNNEKITLTYTTVSSNAGTYTKDASSNGFRIVYSEPSNYRFAGVGNLIIEKAVIQNVPQKSVTYNGGLVFTTTDYPTGVLSETVNLRYTAYSSTAGTYVYSKSAGPGYFTLECSNLQNYELGSIGNLLIGKLTPTADNFSTTPPSSIIYDGTAKTITVTPSAGTVGLGEISSIRYSDNVNVGTCYVTVDVMEGTNYTAYNGIQVSSFSIAKATNSVTDPTINSWVQGQTPSTPSGSTAQFGTPYYMYSIQSAEQYSKNVPTVIGKYYVKAVVDSTVNYDAAESNRVPFEIKSPGEKPTPTKEQFVFSPTSFTYDGTAKIVTVSVISGITGMGEVVKTYYSDNVNVGKCSVSIDVAEGTSFTAVNGLYIGTFEIVAPSEPIDSKMMFFIIAVMVIVLIVLGAYTYTVSKRK